MSFHSRRIVPGLAGGHVVLGRPLNILSADFLELLEAAKVSLVNGGVPSPSELLDCVAILSQTPDEAARDLETGAKWKVFGNKGRFRLFRRWMWGHIIERVLRGGKLYEEEVMKLSAWLEDNWKPPKIKWKTTGAKQAAAPYTDHLRILLCEKGIVSDMAAAGLYPLSDAAWEAEAAYEAETGESRLESASDRKAEELLDESIRLAKEEAANG